MFRIGVPLGFVFLRDRIQSRFVFLSPRDPSVQIIPTLGPKVCKCDLTLGYLDPLGMVGFGIRSNVFLAFYSKTASLMVCDAPQEVNPVLASSGN